MNKKSAANTAAVIEIGTDTVRMHVSQLSKGAIVPLDQLEYPIRLGHDVFESGSISFDSLRELSGVLDKFSSALLTYNVQKPKVVSCTALREAGNRTLAVDQLRVRNGVEATVLEDSQEKSYVYSEIIKKLSGKDFLKKGNTAFAYVGSGSIGVAVYDGEKIVYSQNIPMGALKLHDVLQGVRGVSEDFHTVVEEYLDTVLNRIAISEFKVSNLVLTGSQMGLMAKLCHAKNSAVPEISADQISQLYLSLRALTPESIGLRYGISENQAAVFYTALSIYRAMLRFCPGAKAVYSPSVDISDAILREQLIPKDEAQRQELIRESVVACAEAAALHFGCNSVHSQYIRSCSCRIFDKLKKVHGLDTSKRLILELAAILHSCGSFVSVRQHNRCTFDLIRGMDLFGLSRAEVMEVAFVAGSISNGFSEESDPDFVRLSNKERLVISKLSAIFRVANALDKSHKEKLRDLKVNVEDDRVFFKATADCDTLLEQWAFAESAQFFKEVFGLSPELAIKFQLL